MTVNSDETFQIESDKEEIQRLLAGFNDVLDLFSEVQEI